MIEKIRAVHLIESNGDQGRKYLKVPRLKYLMVQNMRQLPKSRTKY